ncbi:acyltransferase-domain-containing protein [Irpex rosettiformis]|uniref:Acyltransferase-domain-containing protein n=1 Tax=Irpex rosettiformis TaxID=378272 RepID=A0ACB8UK03_9APHY|nr:acyltransferase-domain-containing protein [Irpex rosettiformis]
MTDSGAPHALQISKRARNSWAQNLRAIAFTIVFNIGCIMVNGFQFTILLPLGLLPFPATRKLYEEGIRYSKGAFGTLIVLVSQLFAPTTLAVTFQREGSGSFTDQEIERVVGRDSSGRVVSLHLPERAVLIANHQMYADWWYAWCLTYFMGTYKDVLIVLKKSLKWVPIVGWGMQFYRFIFLSRSWASDRLHLANSLAWLGREAQTKDTPLTFILYPEGTLVSKDTRPISKKFADKLGIPDMRHTLLPRSTGLHYSLRSLAPRIPSLGLIDITVAYPGIPPYSYGQSYYTLRSIFFDGVPPPTVHMHIRKFNVAQEVPIGDLSTTNPSAAPSNKLKSKKGHTDAIEVDIPETEKDKFDNWLRDLWRHKDDDLERYLATGSFVADRKEVIEIPVALKRKRDALDAFCFFIPAVVGWLFSRITR